MSGPSHHGMVIEVVNVRSSLVEMLHPAAELAPVEWRVSRRELWCPTRRRVATMDARAAAIADGRAPGAGLAARASAALHRRHQRQGRGADRGALSRAHDRPRRPVHLSRPRPARGLRDARPQAARPRRAPLRRDAGGMDHPHAGGVRRRRRTARRPHRRLGARGPTRAPATRTRSRRSASGCSAG